MITKHQFPRHLECRLPAAARGAQAEAAQWQRFVWRTVQQPGAANAGDVAWGLLLAAEVAALFKVGEVIGRGTLFGYWP